MLLAEMILRDVMATEVSEGNIEEALEATQKLNRYIALNRRHNSKFKLSEKGKFEIYKRYRYRQPL